MNNNIKDYNNIYQAMPSCTAYYKNLVGYQKAMNSLIEVEKELIHNNDPNSKKELTKIRLQKKVKSKKLEEVHKRSKSINFVLS